VAVVAVVAAAAKRVPHVAMVSHPDAVTALIEKAAKAVQAAN